MDPDTLKTLRRRYWIASLTTALGVVLYSTASALHSPYDGVPWGWAALSAAGLTAGTLGLAAMAYCLGRAHSKS
jgi:hypothetical protein